MSLFCLHPALGIAVQQPSMSAGTLAPSNFYRAITIDNVGGAAKSNWPVKIALTSSNFTFAHANSNGTNTEMRASDGTTQLQYWRQDWDSLGQTGTLWVLVSSIGAGATATVRLYYGAGITDRSNGALTFTSMFEDFNDPDSFVNADPARFAYFGNERKYANPMLAIGASGSWNDSGMTELGNIVYDTDDVDANRRYKWFVGGRKGSASPAGDSSIGIFYSPDCTTWTPDDGNPIIAVGDDPIVVKVDSTHWHMYFENPGNPQNSRVYHYTSSNGMTWTIDPVHAIAIPTINGTWQQSKTGSPCAVYHNGAYAMLYDGVHPVDGQAIGLATSADGSTWTLHGSNPIITEGTPSGMVPSHMFRAASGEWVVMAHNGTDTTWTYTTTDDPSTWTVGTFTKQSTLKYRDIEYLQGPNGQTLVGAGARGARMYDKLGKTTRVIYRTTTNDNTIDPDVQGLDILDGVLRFVPAGTGTDSFASAMKFDAGLASNFAVCYRMRSDAIGSGRKWSQVRIGSGTPAMLDNTRNLFGFQNGYGVLYNLPGSTASNISRQTNYVSTALGAAFEIAGQATYTIYELRYLATGALSFHSDGTLLRTATDSNHVAAAKDVIIAQGYDTSTARGADAFYDWVFVRPYDGVDPTATVGSEVAT